jgi:hypothetical protein
VKFLTSAVTESAKAGAEIAVIANANATINFFI